MQQFNRNILLAALVTVLPALSAQAVTVQRNEVRMATDVCQPALPASSLARLAASSTACRLPRP